jgi:hypothetical protein
LFPLFASGVLDTGDKFSSGVVDTSCILPPVANLPLLSTTPVVLVAEFSTSVVDTDGKFATSVVVMMVHLHLQISLQIFKKI